LYLCVGNRNATQLDLLSNVLFPSDSSKAIKTRPGDFSRALVERIDTFVEAREQAKFLEAVENSTETDPATLQILQLKYKQFALLPIKEHKVFYAVNC